MENSDAQVVGFTAHGRWQVRQARRLVQGSLVWPGSLIQLSVDVVASLSKKTSPNYPASWPERRPSPLAKHLFQKIHNEIHERKYQDLLACCNSLCLTHCSGNGRDNSPVDIIVLKGDTGVGNASVRVDGQYRGTTDVRGHLYIPDLTVGFHTVNAQYEDISGKYVGDSGFEIKPGTTIAKVYLERSR